MSKARRSPRAPRSPSTFVDGLIEARKRRTDSSRSPSRSPSTFVDGLIEAPIRDGIPARGAGLRRRSSTASLKRRLYPLFLPCWPGLRRRSSTASLKQLERATEHRVEPGLSPSTFVDGLIEAEQTR